jgi:hypothetical protein
MNPTDQSERERGALLLSVEAAEETGSNCDTELRRSLAQLFPSLTFNQCKFLAAFSRCGVLTRAADLTGIWRSNHRIWIHDPVYKRAFDYCKDEARDIVEWEIRKRAVEGWDEPVYYKGSVCGTIRRFSDSLAIFHMKALDPERYGDKVRQELSRGKDAEEKSVETLLAERLTPAELLELQAKLLGPPKETPKDSGNESA